MTDVLEQHDREDFEIFAYYCGIKPTDATQARIKASVDHWPDINGMTDDEAAAQIAADGIDILVDLNGYTKDARIKRVRAPPGADQRQLARLSRHDGLAVSPLYRRR